jgi:uncharacterized membrane protein
MFVVALVGFIDATYLAVEHYQGVIPPCTVTAGCELVLTSSYAAIFGIPVSLLGALYYLAILAGLFAYLDFRKTIILNCTFLFTIFGLLASLWFVYLQIFVIHSYCTYCLGSALTSAILFVTAALAFPKYSAPDTLLE